MTDWFETNQPHPEDPENDSPETTPQNAVGVPPTEGQTQASAPVPNQPDTTSAAGGWHSPPTNGYSGHTPTSGEPGSTGSGDPSSQHPPVHNGYRPQGGYSPYSNWQPSSSFAPPSPPSGSRPPKPPKRNTGNGILAAALSVVCVICLVLSGVLIYQNSQNGQIPSTSPGTSDAGASNSGDSSKPTIELNNTEIQDGGLTTAEIVQKNLNSTVVIKMYSRQAQGGIHFSTGNTESYAGQGSGIVMSEDGYIITNQHVVYNEDTGSYYDRIDVTFYDGSMYTATVVGADKDTDLAVIKVEATGLVPVTFGDSGNLNLGDRVVTLGNSGGLPWSVSQGIISGLDRDVYDETGYSIKCLQIDAVINPGNSGGPLFNANGEVVGVNSAKIVYEGYEGLGFSIPISEAKPVIDDIIANGYVTGRIALRITGYTVTQSGYEGFMIDSIQSDSSLNGTGAQKGDIITHVNDTRVRSHTELKNAMSQYAVGDTVELTLLRFNSRTGQSSTFTISVNLLENQE